MTDLTQPAEGMAASDAPGGGCPACDVGGLELFYQVPRVPAHSCLLLPTRREALAFPVGAIALAACPACGFITNTACDPGLQAYSSAYEDQQSFSPTFQKFAQGLASRLVARHGLHGKRILEIGCSKGDFLVLLCELGGNHGVGIDPSALPGRVDHPAAGSVSFIQDYYSERHAEHTGDFVCCRHTLEHIPQPTALLRALRRAIGSRPQVGVFFEVPDTRRVLQELAFWDIYYEHCSYFTAGSFARLFRRCGFRVAEIALEYGNQYLLLEAAPASGNPAPPRPLEESPAELLADVRRFASSVVEKRQEWTRYLDERRRRGARIAIWGSGSKCVSFLSTLGAADMISSVVDVNPHRHGKFLPGLGIEILPPARLAAEPPDEVIAMNPVYREEISRALHQMSIAAPVVAL